MDESDHNYTGHRLIKTLLALFIPFIIQAAYVGDQACQSCHHKEHKAWSGSHHDLAMQKADGQSVLGDFSGVKFDHHGIITTFYMKGKKFMVNTDGADGKLHDFEVTHTFGVYPLQQYMVPFEGGRLQVLDIAWDSRPKEEGGQRWFHIHQDDKVTAGDVLHWSGPNLNWNFMCADCHSTDLRKGYDPETKSYHTTYAQIDVSCESCHGEGSEHLHWAEQPQDYNGTLRQGLAIDLSMFAKARWSIDPKSGKPKLSGEVDHREVQLCAKCHSRRAQLDDSFAPGERFEEHYLPATLSDTLYFSDGKIKDEVYVYGSFKQSRMYEAGVSCSDCHDPHTTKRHALGDHVCDRCHRRVDYDTKQHHHHDRESADCIDCHMLSRTYMGIDERNDHSFRIPRPDLSDEVQAPNACNACHEGKSNKWSSDALKQWYGKTPKGHQRFAHALHSLAKVDKEALDSMYAVLMSDAPDIAKATAVGFLGDYPSQQTYMTTLQMLRHPAPEIQIAAIRSMEGFPEQIRSRPLLEMLDDEVKSVRIEAAGVLSGLAQRELPSEKKALLAEVLTEYEATLRFNADRPESQVALARLHINAGAPQKATAAFKEAIRLQKWYVPAYVNYADFLRSRGDEQGAYKLLQQGLEVNAKSAELHYAMGLWQVRAQASEKALASLKKAVALDPQDPDYTYVYAVALSSSDLQGAIALLETNVRHHSGHVGSLFGLAHYYRLAGDRQRSSYFEQQAQRVSQFIPKIDRPQ